MMSRTTLVILLIALATAAHGQITIGAGATLADINGYRPDFIDRVGYYITAEATEKVNQYFALSGSVQWVNQHADPISVNSIGVGLYAKALPFSGLSVVAGMQSAMITSATYDGEALSGEYHNGMISAALGAGYFLNERIEVKTMYLKQITEDEIFTGTFQLGVNYKIRD